MIVFRNLIAIGCVIAFLAVLYLFAFEKGYEKHKAEVARQTTEVIVSSRNDLIEAVKEVKKDEKNIKDTVECNDIFNFDLTVCLSK